MKVDKRERGGKTALMVIDVQNGVVADGHDAGAVVARIGSLIEHAHEDEIPVIYIQHESEELAPGSDAWKIRPEIAPQNGDPVIAKHYGDAFMETDLEATLAGLGVGRIVITGAQTDACVRATLVGALRDGYDVTLVSDAHTTSDWAYQDVTSKASETIARMNIEAPFFDYPETESTVATTEEVLNW